MNTYYWHKGKKYTTVEATLQKIEELIYPFRLREDLGDIYDIYDLALAAESMNLDMQDELAEKRDRIEELEQEVRDLQRERDDLQNELDEALAREES
jgi:chromosome segregation ATPase